MKLLHNRAHPDPENNVNFYEADFLELVSLKDEKKNPLVTFDDSRKNIQDVYDMPGIFTTGLTKYT